MKDIESISPLDQLDVVLKLLTEEEYPCYNSAQISSKLNSRHGISANIRQVDFILFELLKDKYVTNEKQLVKGIIIQGKKLIDIDEPFYFITFPGKVHLQKGGYKKVLERESSEMEKAKSQAKRIEWGTIGAALIAAIFLFWEIWKVVCQNIETTSGLCICPK